MVIFFVLQSILVYLNGDDQIFTFIINTLNHCTPDVRLYRKQTTLTPTTGRTLPVRDSAKDFKNDPDGIIKYNQYTRDLRRLKR